MLVGVYQDKGRVSDTTESAETVKIKYRQFFSWRIPTKKQTVRTHKHKRFHKDTVSAKKLAVRNPFWDEARLPSKSVCFCVAS